MTRLVMVLVFIALPCFAAGTACSMPSHSQIEKWWKSEDGKSPDEELHVKEVRPIRLKGGEKAFVASVIFPTRGHCCGAGILLIRPDLQEARQLHSVSNVQIDRVIDIDGDGIDELAITDSQSGLGSLGGNKLILSFDGWSPGILHMRAFGDNLGSCGSELSVTRRSCHSESERWTFVDLNGDGAQDLVELVDCEDGPEPERMAFTTTVVNVYLFKDKKFVRLSPELNPFDHPTLQRPLGLRPPRPRFPNQKGLKNEIGVLGGGASATEETLPSRSRDKR